MVTYLLVEFDESGLELLFDLAAGVVDEGGLGVGLALLGLLSIEVVGVRGLGHGVERHLDVLPVADLLQLNVGHFLVAHYGGVVGDDVSGEFGEIRSHDD